MGRVLLFQRGENETSDGKNCTEPAIHEFPDDIFTKEERRNGAVLLHVVCATYMFYSLAIVCDDYFVPSLEKICEHLDLTENVAGATFMAAGSSAPELFTSLIGVFITKGDVGVGTIVGSAVFNILCIIGMCGVFAKQVVPLSWWPLLRDSVFYTLSVIALILVIHDEFVTWWESTILMGMYGLYILVMKFNSKIQNYLEEKKRDRTVQVPRSPSRGQEAEGGSNEMTMVMLRKGHSFLKASVLMVDELLCAHPHKLTFQEASLRIMITRHFAPKTRLCMASRMVIMERQRLARDKAHLDQQSEAPAAIPWEQGAENGAMLCARPDGLGDGGEDSGMVVEFGENDRQAEQGAQEDAGNENDGPFVPFKVPDSGCDIFKWVVAWPVCFLLHYTVPNCVNPRWEKWFMATFFLSTLWIGIFSYIMVWMVTIIGYTLGIPDVIMGITFLAAGTSVPDCMASLIVARQGLGDMAVSNSIGSNVFDILLGLGFPWTIQTLAVDYGSSVSINSKGLVYSVILLLASVFLTVLSVHLNKWKLDRKLGFGTLFLYAVFLCCSILIELNIFSNVNLPTCQ
ncbi:sodium/potassium/calcium exchanger 3-like [Latimeria chalumnae]|uniref:sodium/potassium/calcium exchanger 3-like n=1 Tax=Latimeria chalumnae TaxID=7897 RepID=UPI00313EE448